MAPATARQGSVCVERDLKGTCVTSVLLATSTTLCASVSICQPWAWVGMHKARVFWQGSEGLEGGFVGVLEDVAMGKDQV